MFNPHILLPALAAAWRARANFPALQSTVVDTHLQISTAGLLSNDGAENNFSF
jgi:hypothetical protein